MQVSYEEVAAHVGGEMVGGQLIARIDRKHEILGVKRGTQFFFTELGTKIANELEQKKIADAVAEMRAKSQVEDSASASDLLE